MASSVIRQDVIELITKTNTSDIDKLQKELDQLRKIVSGLNVDKPAKEMEKLGKTDTKKLNNGLENVKKNLTSIGNKAAGAAYNGLKKVAGISFKALSVGITAAAAGIGAISKNAVQAYGEYEQLKGGVETLFKDNSNTIMKYANDAYKTAGLSANAYMNTVTSFSASLLQGLGGDTKKAADYGNMAVTDMADNANKMGTDIGSIQTAYQGFSKQNYTMLDNLKLGFGGTKTEMERLVKDAAKIDKSINSNSLSFDNVVKAIHVVQQNMGITGTTAKEASETIQGSLSSMKSAWGNLLTSFVIGGDSLDQCINNFVDSTMTFLDNVMPALEKGLTGIGTFIERIAPIIETQFPLLVDKLLPPLLKAATSLVKGLIIALPSIVKTVIQELPDILKQLSLAIAEAFGMNTSVFDKMGNFFSENTEKIKIFGGVLLGLIGSLMVFSKVKSIGNIFSGLFGKSGESSGKGGSLFGGIFDNLAKLKPSAILKALANITLIVSGLTLISAIFIPVANEIAKNTDLKAVLKVVSVISLIGIVGTGLAWLSGLIGNIPVSTVAKGLANIAIIMGGLGALLFVATKVFEGGIDFKELVKVISMIGILGTVGSILTVFAGIVGMIPIPVVLAGLANMALVLGGLTALISAYGALGQIPGYNEFIKTGGDVLANIFNQIGKIGGSLIGGIGEGISDSLPKIGENLSKFAEALRPMFSMLNGADLSGAGAFFGALGDFMLKMGGEKLLSVITGGTDLKALGQELNSFATNSEGFFTKVASFPANGFENAKLMFNALAGINSLPKEGGVVGWFNGAINYENLANGLGKLSSEQVIGFFGAVASIPSTAFEQTKLMFNALAGINSLPKEGGLLQWFTGDTLTAIGSLTDKLPSFGEAVASFYNSISEISDFSKISQLFVALGSIGENVGKEGGIAGFIKNLLSGDKKTGLEKLGEGLKTFGENTKAFFEHINGLNLDNLNGLWASIKSAGGISADTVKAVGKDIDEIVKKVSELPVKMGEGLKSAGESLKSSLVYIWQEAVKAMANPVNKIVDGANHILKQFDSDKLIAKWTPYAKGTDGHKGGNALVNDGRGAELIQMPNGNTYLPQGRNVFIPNAPKGMKVLPAEQTAKLIGKTSPTFHYADGIGDMELFNYIDNPSGLIDKLKGSVSYEGMKGFALNAGKGMVNTITGQMASWVKKMFDEFGAKSLANYAASGGVSQWESTVMRALMMTGQFSAENVKRTLYQMQTESGGNPAAINLWDSNAKKGIPSKGLMQVIDPTFRAYAMPGFNSNIYDPLSNILASIRYAVSRYGSLARAFQGHGYANGGIANKPSVFGEDGAEMAIPLSKDKRKRGLDLWNQTGTMLGVSLPQYSPESGGTGNQAVTENNSYNPVFNLTINGSADPRSQERQVKRWISEAMNEMFESMARKTPQRA